MSLVASAVGESDLLQEGEEATLDLLLRELLSHNRLRPESLIALRIGLPSGEAARSVLEAAAIERIPVFWERLSTPRIEIFVRLKRRRKLRPLKLGDSG